MPPGLRFVLVVETEHSSVSATNTSRTGCEGIAKYPSSMIPLPLSGATWSSRLVQGESTCPGCGGMMAYSLRHSGAMRKHQTRNLGIPGLVLRTIPG
jgi:hypothetical protein